MFSRKIRPGDRITIGEIELRVGLSADRKISLSIDAPREVRIDYRSAWPEEADAPAVIPAAGASATR